MKIELAARAAGEAERGARWWREHRLDSPKLFEDELWRALHQIRSEPGLGVPYKARSGREYRRILMPVTRYHVYYRLLDPTRIRVAAIWSATRGKAPAL